MCGIDAACFSVRAVSGIEAFWQRNSVEFRVVYVNFFHQWKFFQKMNPVAFKVEAVVCENYGYYISSSVEIKAFC
jgi:hypothetical protein